jgi:hypothetical protein
MAFRTLTSTGDLDPEDRRRRFIFGTLAVVMFGIVAVTTSLSDSAPRALSKARETRSEITTQIEETFDVDVPSIVDRNDVPFETDDIMHLTGWTLGTILVGFSMRRWIRIEEVAVLVFIGSVCIEIAQPLWSTTRIFQIGDITTNALGVMCGLTVLVAYQRLRPISDAP